MYFEPSADRGEHVRPYLGTRCSTASVYMYVPRHVMYVRFGAQAWPAADCSASASPPVDRQNGGPKVLEASIASGEVQALV